MSKRTDIWDLQQVQHTISCSKPEIETLETDVHHVQISSHSSDLIVDFEHISDLFLLFLLLNLSR